MLSHVAVLLAVVLLAVVALASRQSAAACVPARPPDSRPRRWPFSACPCPSPCPCLADTGRAMRLRGGRRPRLPPESDRRSRRGASPDESSSSSEFPLVAHEDTEDELGDNEDEDEEQTTEAHDDESNADDAEVPEQDGNRWGQESRRATVGGEREEREERVPPGGMSDGDAAGHSTGDASEFVIRLRRSSSPRGSLIATRISRIVPPHTGAPASASGPPTPDGSGASAAEVDSPPLWRLVFADSTENDEVTSSIFRRGSARRRGRVRRARAREVCVCVCVCAYMYIIYIYMYVHIHVYVCTYIVMYTFIHMHIYIYIQVYIYIHTHTRVCVCLYRVC